MVETPLQMAHRHVVEQESRIVRQQELIERLARHGLPTAEAANLLESMNELLTTFRADLDRLSN
jgi:hypothetical protein